MQNSLLSFDWQQIHDTMTECCFIERIDITFIQQCNVESIADNMDVSNQNMCTTCSPILPSEHPLIQLETVKFLSQTHTDAEYDDGYRLYTG